MSVTAQTKATGERPDWSAEGKGMAFGSVVQRAIEMLGKGLAESELALAVEMLEKEEGLTAEHVSDAERLVRSVLASELWQRSLRARRRLFEVPLLMRKRAHEGGVPGNDVQGAGSEVAATSAFASVAKHIYVRGVIDFLFEEQDGWVMVDFKTDSVTEEKLQSFIDFYRPQVRTYASEWELTFGYQVNETGLYFAQLGKFEIVFSRT